jgi:hypothetical protein
MPTKQQQPNKLGRAGSNGVDLVASCCEILFLHIRCGVTLYISADFDESLPTTVIPNSEEGKIINEKVFGAFAEMWRQFGDASTAARPKWFVKADDDTFMQLDNLLALLARYDSDQRHYIGRAGEWRGVRYCGGGAGYVLSRALLRDWAPHIASCKRLPVGEDVSVGLVSVA